MFSLLRCYKLLMVAVVSVSISGCGGGGPGDTPDLGEVTGVVTLDGTPVADATVKFQPTEGRASEGVTGADGSYSLRYSASESGAKVGEHQVFVTTATEGHAGEATAEDEGGWVEGKEETIPEKYQQEGTLTKTVEAGSNTIDLELKSE